MASPGDTITYSATVSRGPVSEDITGVGRIEVDYLNGAGGEPSTNLNGGAGGRVENVAIDARGESTLYLWVPKAADRFTGRYLGGSSRLAGADSTEIAFVATGQSDSSDEPFLVGAGGGSGAHKSGVGVGPGARDNASDFGGSGVPPPAGGDRGQGNSDGAPGEGAIATRPVVAGGQTITGGGGTGDAEIQISYADVLEAPSNLNLEILP